MKKRVSKKQDAAERWRRIVTGQFRRSGGQSGGQPHDAVSAEASVIQRTLDCVARQLLYGVSLPYSAVMQCRNRYYDRHDTGYENQVVHRADVPVIAVGNLTMGGTGKTPAVAWIVWRLIEQGHRPVIISRGYGSKQLAKEKAGRLYSHSDPKFVPDGYRDSDDSSPPLNDEARELALQLPGVPHFQDPDRVASVHRALAETDCTVIVADDAFQHRRLHRDLNVVLIDASEPFGLGHVFPRGTLREPLSGLRRADVVLLSRADTVTEARRGEIRERLMRYAPDAQWCECRHRGTVLRDRSGKATPLESLADRRVMAFCAIGSPASFFDSVKSYGAELVAEVALRDHDPYHHGTLQRLAETAADSGAELAVCTMKDLVKLGNTISGDTGVHVPIQAVAIELELTEGREGLEQLIEERSGDLHIEKEYPTPSVTDLDLRFWIAVQTEMSEDELFELVTSHFPNADPYGGCVKIAQNVIDFDDRSYDSIKCHYKRNGWLHYSFGCNVYFVEETTLQIQQQLAKQLIRILKNAGAKTFFVADFELPES